MILNYKLIKIKVLSCPLYSSGAGFEDEDLVVILKVIMKQSRKLRFSPHDYNKTMKRL